MNTKQEKRPRHYAAEILALKPADRVHALALVPPHFREWVCDLVDCALEKRIDEAPGYPGD